MAASRGPLSFTGNACKLPGNSQSIYKGYIFDLIANNVLGPNPLNAVTVITGVAVNGTLDPNYAIKVIGGNPVGCTCYGNCGGGKPQFCTPDGVVNQRVIVYTSADLLGNSQNGTFTVWYQRYECTGATCTPFDPAPVQISTAVNSLNPAQGAQCMIQGWDPPPASPVTTTTTTGAPGTTTTTTTEAPVTTTTTTEAPVTTTTTTAGP